MKAVDAHHAIASTATQLANHRFRQMMQERGEATDVGPFQFEPWHQWKKPFRFHIDEKTIARYSLTEEELQPIATQAVRYSIAQFHGLEVIMRVIASERSGASFWQGENP